MHILLTAALALLAPAGPATGPDVSIQLTEPAEAPRPGDRAEYTFTITNNGPGNATAVTATFTMPPALLGAAAKVTGGGNCKRQDMRVICAFGDLVMTEQRQIALSVTIDKKAEGTLDLNASTASAGPDDNPSDNELTHTLVF